MNRTIAKIGYAPITARAATGYTYGNVKWFDENGGAGRNVSSTPFGETYSIFGNGRMIYGGEINNGRDLEVTLIDILDDIRRPSRSSVPGTSASSWPRPSSATAATRCSWTWPPPAWPTTSTPSFPRTRLRRSLRSTTSMSYGSRISTSFRQRSPHRRFPRRLPHINGGII